jgi:hypothetical protein
MWGNAAFEIDVLRRYKNLDYLCPSASSYCKSEVIVAIRNWKILLL